MLVTIAIVGLVVDCILIVIIGRHAYQTGVHYPHNEHNLTQEFEGDNYT